MTGLLAVCALPVGILLIAAPDGHLLGASTAWLADGAPFTTYLVPGLFLAGLVGGGALLVTILVVRRARAAALATALLGVVVMVWIALQLAMIRVFSPLHAIIFAMGLGLTLVGARGGAALWVRWVLANAAGELVGLGAIVLAASIAGPWAGGLPAIYVPGMLLLGALEGLVVGVAQAAVLRGALPRLRPRTWTLATMGGAVAGWTLGLLPSLLMSRGEIAPRALDPVVELALAAGLGAVAGPLLATFQLTELRRHVRHARWWLAASALSWAAGMPVLFVAGGMTALGPGRVAAFLLAAGAIVGAIQGLALLILTRPALNLRPPDANSAAHA